MDIDNEMREGARNAVRVCMNVGAEDRVFIFSDEETLVVGQALANEAKATGAIVKLVRLEDYATRPIHKAPEELLRQVIEFKPSVTFYAANARQGELSLRMDLFRSMRNEIHVRHAHMVSVTPQLMREGMRADYQKIHALTHQVYERVREAKTIKVTSSKGSELTAHFDPKLKWVPCHGLYHKQGMWGNLPEGEVYTSPATVEGTLVADVLGDYFSPKYGVLAQPVIFEIESGRVKRVQSEDKSIEAEVWEYLKSCENGRRAGEFAIGTNTAISKLSGNLLQDEKIPGVHVAFGDPYGYETGADWTSKVHIDVIPTHCTIEVDGEVIMREGIFQFLR